MTELPRGIVTFLFTDIEGSTRLWERDAGVMWAALSRHNAILGDAISRNRGFHFKTIGDAYQAAFADPVDALRATMQAQCRLAAESWEDTGPLRVRMALHAGPAQPVDGDYLAPCLNRLSRLLSTGYGGQVLLSDTVRAATCERLPDGVSLRDLGKHRLRDLLEPEQVTQVVIEGLPDTFPPLKSLERHPTNLPIQPNPLVGRERELATITAMLAQGDSRIVTLTGIGGTGKTRLALQAGAELLDRFFDGVFLVDLAPVSAPDLVIPTIAATLGVRESGGLPLAGALVAYLNGKNLLLVLDNVEHLLEAAPDIAGLLERCDGLRILATSRARLAIRGEREITISPLDVPAPGRSLAEIAGSDAVSLFVQRAASAVPGFTLTSDNAEPVAHICARLDGLPLAIELAASRIKTLSPRALLERLDRRLDLLTTGSRDLPARQRTLRATIEWSHDLLPSTHRAFFDKLAVFSGGFDLDAARIVAGNGEDDALDVLTSLLDRSLVRRTEGHDDMPRFTMLETLREFGMEQLEYSGIRNEVREAHATWCLSLAETANDQIMGPRQSEWLERLELEHDNMRGALSWFDAHDQKESRLRLTVALSRFWLIRGHLTDARHWLDTVITVFRAEPTSDLEIKAMNASGNVAFVLGDVALARQRYEASLRPAEVLGDLQRQADLLNNLGNALLHLGESANAEQHYEASLRLAIEMGDDFRRANALGNLGTIAHYRVDVEGALSRYSESLKAWRRLGHAQGEVTMLVNLLLLLAPRPEHAVRAQSFGERCLTLARRLGDRQTEGNALMGLGLLKDATGDLGAAAAYFAQSLECFQALDALEHIRSVLTKIAVVDLDREHVERGTVVLLDMLDIYSEADDLDGAHVVLEGVAIAALRHDEPTLAARILGAAERMRETLGIPIQHELTRRHERLVSQLRHLLGPSFDASMAEGREHSLQKITAEVRCVLRAEVAPEMSPLDQILADLDGLLADTHSDPGAA